jgi:hypothetical protein
MLVSGMTVVIMILPGGTISVTAFAVGSAGVRNYRKAKEEHDYNNKEQNAGNFHDSLSSL